MMPAISVEVHPCRGFSGASEGLVVSRWRSMSKSFLDHDSALDHFRNVTSKVTVCL